MQNYTNLAWWCFERNKTPVFQRATFALGTYEGVLTFTHNREIVYLLQNGCEFWIISVLQECPCYCQNNVLTAQIRSKLKLQLHWECSHVWLLLAGFYFPPKSFRIAMSSLGDFFLSLFSFLPPFLSPSLFFFLLFLTFSFSQTTRSGGAVPQAQT